MKRILIIHSDAVYLLPPLYSSMLILNDLGWQVSLITMGVNEFWKEEMQRRNIRYEVISVNSSNRIIKKIEEIFFFKRYVLRSIKKIGEYDYVWLEGRKIFQYINPNYFHNKKVIIQVLELYEKEFLLRKRLRKYLLASEITFVPEYVRANLFRMWFNLTKLPIVLPNCPYKNFVINNCLAIIEKSYPTLYRLITEQKKIIIYQGGIGKERDISNVIRYIDLRDDNFVIVIIGPSKGAEKYLEMSDKVYYLGHVDAPFHLAITSYAYIGLLNYKPIILNNLFCAPNKIYEYAKFGIPILGNDIPGLYYLLRLHNAGLTCDMASIQKIGEAFDELCTNYDKYSNGSYDLYNSTDNSRVIDKALD